MLVAGALALEWSFYRSHEEPPELPDNLSSLSHRSRLPPRAPGTQITVSGASTLTKYNRKIIPLDWYR